MLRGTRNTRRVAVKNAVRNRPPGFTLIEIIAVLVILGVLAAVALPYYFDMQKDAERKAAASAVAEAQGRIHIRFGKEILLGKTCTEARDVVRNVRGLGDSAEEPGKFGQFYILGPESITDEGSVVVVSQEAEGPPMENLSLKVYLPDCGIPGTVNGLNALETRINTWLQEVLDRKFGSVLLSETLELGNGVTLKKDYDVRNTPAKLRLTLSNGKQAVLLELYDRAANGTSSFSGAVSLAKIKITDKTTGQPDYYIVGTSGDLKASSRSSENLERASAVMGSLGLDVKQFQNAFAESYSSGEIAYIPGALLSYN